MKRTLLFFFILLPFVVLANNEKETRLGVSLQKKISKNLDFKFTPSIRLNDFYTYDKSLLDLRVGYNIMNWFKIGIGGRIIFDKSTNTGTQIKSRFDYEISKSIKLNKFLLSPRVRLSQFGNYKNTVKSADKPIFCYLLKLFYQHSKSSLFVPSLALEPRHSISKNQIYTLRYIMGTDLKINKTSSFGLFYLLDQKIISRTEKHSLELTYNYKF